MREEMPDLAFMYPENFPDEIIEKETAIFQSDKLTIETRKVDHGPFASFEWVVPTIFAAYILKPYFEAFLSEAGKDHYQILKSGLKEWVEKGKIIDAQLVSSSPNKLSKNYSQSIVVSIRVQTKNDRQIKMLFDNNLDKEDWDCGINQLLDLLEENYSDFPADKLSSIIDQVNPKPTKIIYGKINPITKKLEFFDDTKLVSETRNFS